MRCLIGLLMAWGVCLAGMAADIRMSPKTEVAMRHVLLNETDSQQVRAATAFGAARVGSAETVKALIDTTKDDSPEVRAACYFALGRSGVDTSLTALRKGVADPAWIARVEALRALAAFAPSKENTTAAAAALKDEDASVRHAALEMLTQAGVPGETEAACLALCQVEPEPGLRAAALEALASRGEAFTYGPVLKKAMTDEDSGVRAAALKVIAKGMLVAARAEVLKALKDKTPQVRREAVTAIAVMGSDAHAALASLASDKDATVRRALADALRLAGAEAMPTLSLLLDDVYRPNRRAASSSMLVLAAANAEARQAVVDEALRRAASKKQSDRIEAMYLIGKLKDTALAEQVYATVKPFFPQPAKPAPAAKEAKGAKGAKGEEKPKALGRDPGNADLSMALWMVGQCEVTALGAEVTGFLDTSDPLARLQAATTIGHLRYAAAVPVIDTLFRKKSSPGPGIIVFDYAGEPRQALVHALRQIGTPEAMAVVDKRFAEMKPVEDEQVLQEACEAAMEGKRVGVLASLRILYRNDAMLIQMQRLLAKTEHMLAPPGTLDMPEESSSSFNSFFLQVKESR